MKIKTVKLHIRDALFQYIFGTSQWTGAAREADLVRDGAADLEPLAHPLSGGGAALQAAQGGRRRQPREESRNMNYIIYLIYLNLSMNK